MSSTPPSAAAATTDGRPSVTVIARHFVADGADAVFAHWMDGIATACSRFEGYLGTELIRPVDEQQPREYASIFRFESYESLRRWIESEERGRWLAKISTFSRKPSEMLPYRSLDFWFADSRAHAKAPPRYKMAIATYAVIWPLVHFIPPTAGRVLPLPRLAVEGISVLSIVLLMTYVVMPTVTRLLRPWLWARE